MSKTHNFRGCEESVIVVEDHFGSGIAVELDKLPHVEAALAELRTSPVVRMDSYSRTRK